MKFQSNDAKGIACILLAALGFALMTFFVRLSGDVPTMEKAFFRNAFAAVIAFVGIFFAETLVIRQQDREIAKTESSAERVHAVTNTVRLEEEGFSTFAAGDEQHFKYTDIKLVDLTDHAIYVWLSDEMIMPLPLHAFRDLKDMKETCKWIREKAGLNE